VPPRELDRLPAALHRQRGGLEARNDGPVSQPGDLQDGPPDPAGQGDTPLKVRVGFVGSQRPQLGDAETYERERAQFLTESGLSRIRRNGRLQLPHLLSDS
jgi:hypothetical protein